MSAAPITSMNLFNGTPTLTPEKVATIKEWYSSAVVSLDNAGFPEDRAYYQGAADVLVGTLHLLNEKIPTEKVVEVVKVVKKNRIFGIRKIYVYAAVIYVIYDGRLIKKVKTRFNEVFNDEPAKPSKETLRGTTS